MGGTGEDLSGILGFKQILSLEFEFHDFLVSEFVLEFVHYMHKYLTFNSSIF
jgi:hypothetical protein